MADRLPFEFSALGSFSQSLSRKLFDALPELRAHAAMTQAAEPDGHSLDVLVPSPLQDKARGLWICVDGVVRPSIEFGPSHTHFGSDDEGISEVVDLASAVLSDQVCILEDVGGKYPGHGRWIDLREADALEEQLTNPYSPGRALLKSWSGNIDRELDVTRL